MRTFAYYPGCALLGTAREYNESTQLVCQELGIGLKEIPDWNCCGASSAHSLNQRLAHRLVARNFKLLQSMNLEAVVVPCAACFNRFKVVQWSLNKDKALRNQLERELDFVYNQNLKIYHLLDLVLQVIEPSEVAKKIKFSFYGINAVSYYGCLLVRPHDKTNFDDKEVPLTMDALLEVIGIGNIDWPYKTECCGASLSLTRRDIVRDLVGRMLSWAKRGGVDCVVTACPLCQANLEMRQGKENFPIFYFTELLALSFGVEKIHSVLRKHLIAVDSILGKMK